ncbi:MAG: hypothetical protein ABSG70_05490, partial [Terriglobales bacterium]
MAAIEPSVQVNIVKCGFQDTVDWMVGRILKFGPDRQLGLLQRVVGKVRHHCRVAHADWATNAQGCVAPQAHILVWRR